MIRRGFPPPDFDSDDSIASRTIWQDNQGFWKEVRRPSTEPWATDSGDSRFRSALDKLQSNKFWDGAVGMSILATAVTRSPNNMQRHNLPSPRTSWFAIAASSSKSKVQLRTNT